MISEKKKDQKLQFFPLRPTFVLTFCDLEVNITDVIEIRTAAWAHWDRQILFFLDQQHCISVWLQPIIAEL